MKLFLQLRNWKHLKKQQTVQLQRLLFLQKFKALQVLQNLLEKF